jgi:N6-L-threonylcarbamoyladenine synthase
MKILGIETSCDETAAAVVDSDKNILSDIVLTQLEEHSVFGGVVPEIAARSHLEHIDKVIAAALKDADCSFDDLDGIAATCGPGLIGGVMVGMMSGKAIASAHNIPFIAINHLEAHALTPRLTNDVPFPYLLMLVSGGHTQILIAEDVGKYSLLAKTLDDALGECFDKSAKAMGLPFPGGPHLEKLARKCADKNSALERFALPRPMKGRKELDFSFSGLKTAVRTHIDKLPAGTLQAADMADMAFSFEAAVCDVLQDRVKRAIDTYQSMYPDAVHSFVVSGGVAANLSIRSAMQTLCDQKQTRFFVPPIKLCADNGVMIAWAGIENMKRGNTNNLDFAAQPRWPLDKLSLKSIAS